MGLRRIFAEKFEATQFSCICLLESAIYNSTEGKGKVTALVYSNDRSPNFSYTCVSNCAIHLILMRLVQTYLVSWYCPATLRNELSSLLIDVGAGGSDLIL